LLEANHLLDRVAGGLGQFLDLLLREFISVGDYRGLR